MGMLDNIPGFKEAKSAAEGFGSNVAEAAGKAVAVAGEVAETAGEIAAPAAKATAEAASNLARNAADAAAGIGRGITDFVSTLSPDGKPSSRVVEIPMPDGYERLKRSPGDPDGSVTYATATPQALAMVRMWPIPEGEWVMPFDDPQSVIDGIHEEHSDNQGLIEVEAAKTSSGAPCIHSIVKTLLEPMGSGVQYTMTMHIELEGGPVSVQGFFEESGTTGVREAMIMALSERGGGDPTEGWWCDPYDAEHTRGVPMNLSEKREYDESWPEHPLTLCRAMAKHVKEVC